MTAVLPLAKASRRLRALARPRPQPAPKRPSVRALLAATVRPRPLHDPDSYYYRNRDRVLARQRANYHADPDRFRTRVRACQTPERRAKRKAILYAGPCVDCGAVQSPHRRTSLERDHRIPARKLGYLSQVNRSPAWLGAELTKTDLVCQPCHVKRTRSRRWALAFQRSRAQLHAT